MDSLEDSLQCPRNCSMGVEEVMSLSDILLLCCFFLSYVYHTERTIRSRGSAKDHHGDFEARGEKVLIIRMHVNL